MGGSILLLSDSDHDWPVKISSLCFDSACLTSILMLLTTSSYVWFHWTDFHI